MNLYALELHEEYVAPYLYNLDLSRQGRIVLADFLNRDLRFSGDKYRNEPERRLSPGSEYFEVDFVFRDPTRRQYHRLRFIISDASAAFGVLRVVYVDDEVSREILGD